jgi:reactive chlorine resistance protein C
MLEVPSAYIQSKLDAARNSVSQFGFVVFLLRIGVLKFTRRQAAGIQPLVARLVMSWIYGLLGAQGVSNLIGVVELATAALITLCPLSPKASFAGSVAAVVTLLLTVKFSVLDAGVRALELRVSVLGDAG